MAAHVSNFLKLADRVINEVLVDGIGTKLVSNWEQNMVYTHKRYPANICWSSRRLPDMSWRRLQHVFSVTIFRLPWRLEDVLKTSCKDVLKTSRKTSWRRLGKGKLVTLKTSWRLLEDISWRPFDWRHILKTSWRHVLKSWRRLLDVLETSKMLTGDICI